MDKFNKSPLSIIGDLCLIAFLMPGHMAPFPGGKGQQIIFGLMQPGWCQLNIDPPPELNLMHGLSFQLSLSWFFLLMFVLSKVISSRESSIAEQYRSTMRRPRF